MVDCYLGEIRLFAGNYAPENWHLCDGSLLSISQYQVLYTLLGTTYGGDGRSNFGLPDLRGRVPVHMGQGPGLANYALGAQGGTETVTLTTPQLPSHTHSFNATSNGVATPTPGPGVTYGTAAPPWMMYAPQSVSNPLTLAPFSSTELASAGLSSPHDNMMPGLVLNFIIAIVGLFPTPN